MVKRRSSRSLGGRFAIDNVAIQYGKERTKYGGRLLQKDLLHDPDSSFPSFGLPALVLVLGLTVGESVGEDKFCSSRGGWWHVPRNHHMDWRGQTYKRRRDACHVWAQGCCKPHVHPVSPLQTEGLQGHGLRAYVSTASTPKAEGDWQPLKIKFFVLSKGIKGSKIIT
jgi:hypothetical protein